MFDRISVRLLVSRHIDTLYDDAYYKLEGIKRIPLADKFLFIGVPAIVALFMIMMGLFINENYLSIILTCLSIFAGLLFGLLPLVFELTAQIKSKLNSIIKDPIIEDTLQRTKTREETKYKIAKELFVNICFAILMSLIAILLALFTRLRPAFLIETFRDEKYYCLVKYLILTISNFAVYFISTVFLLTILMILKRFYLLFDSEISIN